MKRLFRFAIPLTLIVLALPDFVFTSAQDGNPVPPWDVVVVGHRGLAPGYPENTMIAFKNAIALGVDVIEIDLRGTADGEVIVMHDETVNRTTDGRGLVSEMTLEEIKALDAGSYVSGEFADQRVPTYEEVLALAKSEGVQLLLDIKISPTLDKERVVRLTEEYNFTLNVIIGVRSLDELREFKALNPNLRTLGFISSPFWIDDFADAGVNIIRLWPYEIYPDNHQVEYIHNKGIPVWTNVQLSSYEELEPIIRMGVNGILIDNPEVLINLLQDIDAGIVP